MSGGTMTYTLNGRQFLVAVVNGIGKATARNWSRWRFLNRARQAARRSRWPRRRARRRAGSESQPIRPFILARKRQTKTDRLPHNAPWAPSPEHLVERRARTFYGSRPDRTTESASIAAAARRASRAAASVLGNRPSAWPESTRRP